MTNMISRRLIFSMFGAIPFIPKRVQEHLEHKEASKHVWWGAHHDDGGSTYTTSYPHPFDEGRVVTEIITTTVTPT